MQIIHGIFTNSSLKGSLYIDYLCSSEEVISIHNKDTFYYTVLCKSENIYKLYNFKGHDVGIRFHYAYVDNTCLFISEHKENLKLRFMPLLTPAKQLYTNKNEFIFDNHIKYW